MEESGKNRTGEEGKEGGNEKPEQQLRCSAVQSRESSIDVAKHMLRSRREKGDWVYARRAQYLLSSWHSHLSSKAATKKGVLVLYRVATTILALAITQRPMVVVGHGGGGGGAGGGGGGGTGTPISRLPPPNPPSFDHIFPFFVSVTLKPFSAYVTGRPEKSFTSISALFLLQAKCRGLVSIV